MSYFVSHILPLSIFEYRNREQGYLLGYLWSLMNPMIMFLTLFGVFQSNLGSNIPNYPTYLFTGLLLWSLFSKISSHGSGVLQRKVSLLLNTSLPPSVILVSSSLAVLYSSILEAIIAWLVLLVFGAGVNFLTLVMMIISMLLCFFLAISAACFIALLGSFARDVFFLWGLVLRIGIFITPVFYSVSSLPEYARSLINYNPLVPILNLARVGIDFSYTIDLQGSIILIVLLPITIALLNLLDKSRDRFVGHLA